jgi:internalin A
VPEALVRWLGVDYFFRVRILGLGKKGTELTLADRGRITSQFGRLPHLKQLVVPFPVDDADLAPLARMTELKDFILRDSSPGLTDRTLEVLGRLSWLEQLEIGNASITDAGLAHLAHLAHLKYLTIGDAPVTDAGLAHLAGLDQLETLNIGDYSRAQSGGTGRVAITGSGFAPLGRLPHLRLLGLSSTTLSGPGLAGIGRLTHLEEVALNRYGDDPTPRPTFGDLRELAPLAGPFALSVGGFGGDEAGLVHLKDLTGLGNFSSTGLGDAAIPTLLSLPALRFVTFKKHHLTAEGLATLRANTRLRVGLDRLPTAPPAASPP